MRCGTSAGCNRELPHHPGRHSESQGRLCWVHSSYYPHSACLAERQEEPGSRSAPVGSDCTAHRAHLATVSPWQELVRGLAPTLPGNLNAVSSSRPRSMKWGFALKPERHGALSLVWLFSPLLFVFKDEIRTGMKKVSQVLCLYSCLHCWLSYRTEDLGDLFHACPYFIFKNKQQGGK